MADLPFAPKRAPAARAAFVLRTEEVSICDELLTFARTYFEKL
jgi:hypothetical protein